MNYYIKRIVLALTKWIPDEPYLKVAYYFNMGERLNLNNPVWFSEKMQWLKIYDCKDEYHILADKIRVRDYVAKKIGEEHLIKQIGVYNNPEEIPYNSLPNRFVLKCNHDAGSVLICKDKNEFDRKKANAYLAKRLKINFWLEGRENVYKTVVPQILCEEYIGDDQHVPEDYKIYCFGGEPQFIHVIEGRYQKMRNIFFDTNWNRIYIDGNKDTNEEIITKRPVQLDNMLNLACKLAEGIKFVRVDFYIVHGIIYFGEMTFYPSAGYRRFSPPEVDKHYASLIDIG